MTSLSSYGFVFGSADSIGTSDGVWRLSSSTCVHGSFVRGTAGPNVALVTFHDREFAFQRDGFRPERIVSLSLSLRKRKEHSRLYGSRVQEYVSRLVK